jgi:DNA-binding CsgD family transcriptional regulator
MALRAGEVEVVGRDAELTAVRDFLHAVDRLPAALVIEGEAGIGKTTLWRAGILSAGDCGYRVLSTRPTQVESQMSYAGLADLLEPVIEEALAELPSPQRYALEVALLLRDAGGAVPHQTAIAFAFLGVLRAAALERPTLVAVDDLQWLDAPSTFALRFAVRRLREDAVGLLFAVRAESNGEGLPEVGRLLPEERTRVVQVGPLSLGALHHLIHSRLELVLPRPALQRLHQASGGNAFFALELARALQERGDQLAPGEPLPMSGELRQLLRARLAALPEDSKEALLFAAAVPQPKVGLVAAAVAGDALLSLRLGEDAKLVELDGDRIRFAHPLFASAVYSEADDDRRRAIHRRLATIVGDPEERSRHLALCTEGADSAVAAALDEAARIARGRGAPQAAAELSEQALRVTPGDERIAAHRRRLEVGNAQLEAGNTARAHTLFAEAADTAPAGPDRAAALSRLARVHLFDGDRAAAVELGRRALAEVGDDLELRSEIEEGLAVSYYFMRENLVAAAAHAHSSVEAARRIRSERALAEALAAQGLAEGLLGRASARAAFEDATQLDYATHELRIMRRPSWAFAVYRMWTDDLHGARQRLEELYAEAVERGDESTIPLALAHLSGLECLLGGWAEAARWADASHEAAILTGQLPQQAYALAARALVDAHLGSADRTRAEAREALQMTAREPGSYGGATSRAALGLLELSLDNPAGAHEALGSLVNHYEAAGIVEPGASRFVPDEIEALIALGEPDAAAVRLRRLEERARRLGRRSALAAAHRCHGLLAVAGGALDEALADFGYALDELERLPLPFERARTLLALGVAQRHARQRRAARETLERALRQFEELGAALWAVRARAELGRISGRGPSGGKLTASEQRVAELVANGRTNREVATELYITPRTVEGTLSRVYAKLGLRSRTELARYWASRQS